MFRYNLASQVLSRGGVISHPTDSIQSVGCLPSFPGSVDLLLKMKRRNINKGLILLASDLIYVLEYIDFSSLTKPDFDKLAKLNPNPITYIVPASKSAPRYITGGQSTLALRITDNSVIKFLCENTNSALISTSANISSLQAARSTLKLRVYFGNDLDLVLSPKQVNSKPSTIVNLLTGERYR